MHAIFVPVIAAFGRTGGLLRQRQGTLSQPDVEPDDQLDYGQVEGKIPVPLVRGPALPVVGRNLNKDGIRDEVDLK